MAKNKNKKKQTKGNGQAVMSDKQFLREKARQVPVSECYVMPDYEQSGVSTVLVARRHKSDKYTVGLYYLDTFCIGLKDSHYFVRIDEDSYDHLLHRLKDVKIREATYEEAHNLVYGAIAFAEEAGIAPHESFALTRYILEEDTDEVPLIEYNYGKNGKHFLVAGSRLEASRYLPLLEMNLGEGNYDYSIAADEEAKSSMFANHPMFRNYGPETEYTYIHPEYPQELKLENSIVGRLAEPNKGLVLSREEIDEYLALPHDSLRRDLEHLILYLTGQTCDTISDKQWEVENFGLMHALILLGEVGNDESIEVVLETLRQQSDYQDYHFGDIAEHVYPATLFKIARHRLDKLMAFAKEEGLYTYLHYQIFPAIRMMMKTEPDRRSEYIEWFREVIVFATEHIAETQYLDSTLCALIICDLVDVHAHELLPEIKALFDTGLVDEGCCDSYHSVERDITDDDFSKALHPEDIYERYAALSEFNRFNGR